MSIIRFKGQRGINSLRQGDSMLSPKCCYFCIIVWRENMTSSAELKHADMWFTELLLNKRALHRSWLGSLSFLFIELYAHSKRVLTFVHVLGMHHHECYQHLEDSPQPPYIPVRCFQPLPQRAHPTSTFHPWPVCKSKERAPDSSFDGSRRSEGGRWLLKNRWNGG